MLLRMLIAFPLGLAIYMIAMVMTVYDGILSMIFQPIMGSIVTAIALVLIAIFGSPLLIGRLWHAWRRLGLLTLLLTAVGIVMIFVSWHPSMRVQIMDPETKPLVDGFHPALSLGSWLLAMFGIVYCPAIGVSKDRRWI